MAANKDITPTFRLPNAPVPFSLFLEALLIKKFIACPGTFCVECNSDKPTECLRCASTVPNLILDTAAKKCRCKTGYFMQNQQQCLPCSPRCSDCTGPTNDDCVPYKCTEKSYPVATQTTTCLYMCATTADDLFLDPLSLTCKRTIFETLCNPKNSLCPPMCIVLRIRQPVSLMYLRLFSHKFHLYRFMPPEVFFAERTLSPL